MGFGDDRELSPGRGRRHGRENGLDNGGQFLEPQLPEVTFFGKKV